MLSADEIVEKLSQETKKSHDEIRKLIEEKQDELSGLVSEEGAAYIVARELGFNFLATTRRQLRVANLIPGLNSVDIVARVARVFPPREFSRNGKPGVVQNLLLADATGTVRLSLWNDETGLLADGKVKEDDVIRIERGFTKQDNRGGPELRLGRGSFNVVQEEADLPKASEVQPNQSSQGMARKTIDQLKEGDSAELRACILQVYRRNPFYEVCPSCGRRANEEGGKWSCKEHGGIAEPKLAMRVAGVVDDGYGSIRVVFFRETAEKAFGKSSDELRAMMMKSADPLAIFDHFANMGNDMIIQGRVKKSSMNDTLEMVVNGLGEVDVKKERELLVNELGKKAMPG